MTAVMDRSASVSQQHSNRHAADYGHEYWSVMLDVGSRVCLWADWAAVGHDGSLSFGHGKNGDPTVGFTSGEWRNFFRARYPEGTPVAVEDWPGETS